MIPNPNQSFSLRHLIRGSALYGASDVIVAGIRFLLLAVYTRVLPPGEFGIFSIVIVSIAIFGTVAPLGIPSAIILLFRENAIIDNRRYKDLSFSVLAIVLATSSIIFLITGTTFFPSFSPMTLVWICVWSATDVLGIIPQTSLRFKEHFIKVNVSKIFRAITMIGLLYWFYTGDGISVDRIINSEAAGSVVAFLLSMIFDRYFPSLTIPGFKTLLRTVVNASIPLFAVSAGLVILDLSDRYIVFFMLGKEATGLYSAAARVALVAAIMVEAFNSAWTPYIFKLAGNQALLTPRFDQIRRKIIGYAVLPISALMIVLPWIATAKIGDYRFIAPQYFGITPLIAPLLLGFFFKAGMYLSSPLLNFYGKTWKLMGINLAALILNILGNIVAVLVLYKTFGTTPTLIAIALMTSVAYCYCMIAAFKNTGLVFFPPPFQAMSIMKVLALIIILAIPFLPIPLTMKIVFWTLSSTLFLILARSTRSKETEVSIQR